MEKTAAALDVNTCPICLKTFSSKWSVARHVDSTHNKKKFLCQVCNKIFAREDYLIVHLKNVHNENVVKARTKKGRMKTRSKRNDQSMTMNATDCPDNTTILINYKNETSIHDDNTNFEADEVTMDIDIGVSMPIKSDDDDSILSVNWEDSIQTPSTERLHVEDRPYQTFTSMNRSGDQNARQITNNRDQFEDMTFGELVRVSKDAPNAVDLITEDRQLQFAPLIKATSQDCISINSDDEGPSRGQRTKPDNQLAKRPAEPEKQCTTPNRARAENGIPPESQPPEADGQADAASSTKRNHGENDVLVDFNVFDLLKKRTLDSSDEDRMFLLSILSDFKKVLPQNKLSVKIKIAQAISDGS